MGPRWRVAFIRVLDYLPFVGIHHREIHVRRPSDERAGAALAHTLRGGSPGRFLVRCRLDSDLLGGVDRVGAPTIPPHYAAPFASLCSIVSATCFRSRATREACLDSLASPASREEYRLSCPILSRNPWRWRMSATAARSSMRVLVSCHAGQRS